MVAFEATFNMYYVFLSHPLFKLITAKILLGNLSLRNEFSHPIRKYFKRKNIFSVA